MVKYVDGTEKYISGQIFQVFIISYKRAGRITSDGIFNKAYIVIPESQEEEYRKYEYKNGCQLLVIPDEADGNTVRKRNWILDNFKGNIIIVDDDYKYFGMYEGMKKKNLNPDEVDKFLHNGCIMCNDLGTVLWGVNMNSDPMCYREYSPFSLLSPILGPFQGFCNVPKSIRHDERVYMKEDYDISLQVIHKYNKILRFNKYHYDVNHMDLEGGVVSYRTSQKEEEHNRRLQKKWGKDVVKYNMEKSINPIIKVPKKGI